MFCEKTKSGRINSTQETQLMVVLLSDFFVADHADPSKIAFFFNIFELGKHSRKFVLLKFILLGVAIQSSAVSFAELETNKLLNNWLIFRLSTQLALISLIQQRRNFAFHPISGVYLSTKSRFSLTIPSRNWRLWLVFHRFSLTRCAWYLPKHSKTIIYLRLSSAV